MKLQEKLRQDVLKAMKLKQKEKVILLKTIIGEADRIGKMLDDKQLEKIIRQMWTNAVEFGNEFEQEILSSYLSPMMSDEEIDISIRQIVTMNALSNVYDIGFVMKEFDNKNSNKSYDKTVVASTARKWLLK